MKLAADPVVATLKDGEAVFHLWTDDNPPFTLSFSCGGISYQTTFRSLEYVRVIHRMTGALLRYLEKKNG